MRKKTASTKKRGSISIPIRVLSHGGKIGIRTRAYPSCAGVPKSRISDLIKSFSVSFIIPALITGMNWYGLSAIGSTAAYFNDTETSGGNAFVAGSLDLALTKTSHGALIGLAEETSFSSILLNSGTLGWRYTLDAEKISGDDDFCAALLLEAKLNGLEKHDGSLLSLDVPVSGTLGTWKFEIELPVGAAGVKHGDTCETDLVYSGWQEEILLPEESGFSDEERISVALTARMVVLNEFLPNPGGEAYGFDFGDDSSDMPQGEWVEIYNNGDTSVDLNGWYVWDASGAEANKIAITAANTDLASTVIPPGDWLVVYMNKAVLNNTGDTVKLYDASGLLIDSHEYINNDFCEIEPTPGDDNSTTAGGSCGGVPPNKSYARIPDGIGGWVDPIPTPGRRNRLDAPPEIINSSASTQSEPVLSADESAVEEERATADEEVITEEAAVIGETAVDENNETATGIQGITGEEMIVEEISAEEIGGESSGEPEAVGEPVVEEEDSVDEDTAIDEAGGVGVSAEDEPADILSAPSEVVEDAGGDAEIGKEEEAIEVLAPEEEPAIPE